MANNGRTFLPELKKNRILASGVTLFEVDDEGRVIFEDKFKQRCLARGSKDIPVHVLDLLELMLEYYRT